MANQKKNNNVKKFNNTSSVSKSATLRLPYYLRTLRQLLENNIYRVSSPVLAEMMKLHSSQVRQDLASFGASGLKGYGYDVNSLYTLMLDIACVRDEFSAVIFGTDEMITMLTSRPVFIKQGVALKKTFTSTTEKELKAFEEYCKTNKIDIIVLATDVNFTKEAVEIIKNLEIKGVWNFSDIKLELDIPVKNIWIDDSLMTLCYEISQNDKD